jgi:hypothetical protein
MDKTAFDLSTIDPDLFQIQDVIGDNACLYRALANYIYYATSPKSSRQILKFKDWGNVKNIEEVTNEMGVYSDTQNTIAKEIQDLIVNYIADHPREKIPQVANMTIENAVPIIHGISWEEYLAYYSDFAGSADIMAEIDADGYSVDRWGSTIEQYAISKLIQCPVVVFNSQRWDNKYNKIVNGKIVNNKAQKNVRLKPTMIIGNEYMGYKLPIYLIWREYHSNGHYLVLYPKNPEVVQQVINDL